MQTAGECEVDRCERLRGRKENGIAPLPGEERLRGLLAYQLDLGIVELHAAEIGGRTCRQGSLPHSAQIERKGSLAFLQGNATAIRHQARKITFVAAGRDGARLRGCSVLDARQMKLLVLHSFVDGEVQERERRLGRSLRQATGDDGGVESAGQLVRDPSVARSPGVDRPLHAIAQLIDSVVHIFDGTVGRDLDRIPKERAFDLPTMKADSLPARHVLHARQRAIARDQPADDEPTDQVVSIHRQAQWNESQSVGHVRKEAVHVVVTGAVAAGIVQRLAEHVVCP
jgi:hypothetical protein